MDRQTEMGIIFISRVQGFHKCRLYPCSVIDTVSKYILPRMNTTSKLHTFLILHANCSLEPLVHAHCLLDRFSAGTGPIWLDNVFCFSSESTLFSCSHSGVGNHNCVHEEDIAVFCSSFSGEHIMGCFLVICSGCSLVISLNGVAILFYINTVSYAAQV